MNKSTLFKQAHALVKKYIQVGDSYSATFALCLKQAYKNRKISISDLRQLAKRGVKTGTAKNGQDYLEMDSEKGFINWLKNDGQIFLNGEKLNITGFGKEFSSYGHFAIRAYYN